MQTTFALVAALASAAYAAPAPQGITDSISPPGGSPPGAQTSYSGAFEITAINTTTKAKRDLTKRACNAPGSLTLTLQDGILKDTQNRIGYVAANQQFQFDGPPQTGAIYTAGWSVLSNYSLALGPTTVFWQCKSGNPDGGDSGAFYNLYFDKAFDICTPAVLSILPCSGSSTGGGPVSEQGDGQPTGPPASQITDGQVQAPTGNPITQISDGQVQVPTGNPVSQISDGQVQAPTGAPVSQISDGQVQAPTGAPVSQISDGQVQAPTGAPVSQISDGQVQAPTGAPVSQISDGQVQAPTGAPVSQISDGQVQAPTGPAITQISDGQVQAPTGAPITQISDGQVQAPTGAPITQISDGQVQAPTGAPVTQISDGQVQAPTATTPPAAPTGGSNNTEPIPFTGSGSSIKAGLISVLGAVVAVAFL